MGITQRDATRNQSTADVSHSRIFLFNNTYQSAVFLNNTGDELALQPGSLILRNAASASQVLPAIAGATLANVIGIVALDEPVDLADAGTLPINYGTGGDIDETKLVLPATVTLDTIVGATTKTVRDILNGLGFYLRPSTENTKTDN